MFTRDGYPRTHQFSLEVLLAYGMGLFLTTSFDPTQAGVKTHESEVVKIVLPANDSIEIVLAIHTLEQRIRQGDKSALTGLISRFEPQTKEHPLPLVNQPGFSISGIQLAVDGEHCTARFNLADQGQLSLENVSIALRKQDHRWTFEDFDLYYHATSSLKNDKISANPRVLNSEVIRDRPGILVGIQHPGSNPPTYVINQSYTWTNLTRWVFAPTARTPLAGILWDQTGNDIAVSSDGQCNRLVYGRQDPSDSWLRSYGDNPGDYSFDGPNSLTIDHSDRIFVAEPLRHRIVNLALNRSTRRIEYGSYLQFPELPFPSDVSIYHGSCRPGANDALWIADPRVGAIAKVTLGGQLVYLLKYYRANGVLYRLTNPRRVLAPFDASAPLTFIDGERNAFVTFYESSLLNDSTIYATSFVQFDKNTSTLTCIGQDLTRQFWVGDARMGMYHLFGFYGDYLASIATDGTSRLFLQPMTVTRPAIGYTANCTEYGSLAMFTGDLWTPATGLRAMYPGADALDLAVSKTSANFEFRLTLTNLCQAVIAVVDGGNTIVRQVASGPFPPGPALFTTPVAHLPYGNLRFRVSYVPYYNGYYGNWTRQWVWQDVPFFNPAPLEVSAIQGPSNLPPHQNGTFHVNASGNPPLSYSWAMKYNCCGSGPFLAPDPCFEYGWFAGGSPTAVASSGYNFQVQVAVQDAIGQTLTRSTPVSVGNCYVGSGGGSGCPFVYVWDGSRYVQDNNIIPQSQYEGNESTDVTDVYQLYRTPLEEDNRYKLRIMEFESEVSQLDQFRLQILDHSPEVSVALDDSGRILQFAKPSILTNAALDSSVVLDLILKLDEEMLDVAANSDLSLQFTNISGTELRDGDQGLLVVGTSPEKELDVAEVRSKTKTGETDISSFSLRRNPSFTWTMVETGGGDSAQIDIHWEHKARVDYSELSAPMEEPISSEFLDLTRGWHSIDGDVTSLLNVQDQSYVQLLPGQWIELEYNAPPLAEGRERSFFLISRGRYERVDDSTSEGSYTKSRGQVAAGIPSIANLGANFPNPGNPSTQFVFALPEPATVSLSIFDILGRPVANLVNEYRQAGYYSATWSGTNEAGKIVSSGVYLARFSLTNELGKVIYAKTNKVLLMK